MNSKMFDSLKTIHQERYGAIDEISFSSGRINVIGEHVDYNDGLVLPAAIDLGIGMTLSKSKDLESRFYAVDLDQEYCFELDDAEKTNAGSWANYLIGVTSLLKSRMDCGVYVCFTGTIPSGSGLSSSAALENALAFGLNSLFQMNLSGVELALVSQKAEHEYAGVNCGIMDQFASMLGRADSLLYLDCRSLEHELIPFDLGDYEFVLFNSNVKHSLNDSEYNSRRSLCETSVVLINEQGGDFSSLRDVSLADLEVYKSSLSEDQYLKSSFVIQEISRVQQAVEALRKKDLQTLGQLMNLSHKGLSEQYQVSCEELDFLQKLALSHSGVLGSRMMGGGFGGCTLNLVKSQEKETLIAKVQQAYKERFNLEASPIEVGLSNGTFTI